MRALFHRRAAGAAWASAAKAAGPAAWYDGARRLARIPAETDVDLVVSRGAGACVVAPAAMPRFGLPDARLAGLRWLAIDPAVRREPEFVYGNRVWSGWSAGIVQTAGAERRLRGAIVIDRPAGGGGGADWWAQVIGAVQRGRAGS